MRVFLDANILFSAAQPTSRLRTLLEIVSRHGECITNAYAVEEARRNLALKQPSLVPHLATLVRRMEQVPSLVTELPVNLPSKDVPILGGAIAGLATHLLTGDQQDFGAYFGRTIRGVKVVTPRMLADELVRQGWL